MKKILLTGGSGFIGRNILESFLVDKYEIMAPSSKELNLCDTSSVDQFFAENKIETVIHNAVKPGHRNSTLQKGILELNLQMFFNLYRHTDKVEKIINIGSGAVYDNRYYSPKLKEEQFTEHIPVDEYGFGKYISAKVVENSVNMFDLRIFGIFGKYEDYAIRFISNAICKSIFGMPITIKQNRYFDYLYIKDLMPILEYLIDNTPQYNSYNITPDNSISLLELAGIVRKVTNNSNEIIVISDGLDTEYSGDNCRLRNEIKTLEFTPISNAIEELYEYYIAIKERINVEILKIDE